MNDSDFIKSTVAKNISDLRGERGMTQLELAELLCYSDKAVSKWERGESLPDVTVLKDIADLFGVGVDYLLSPTHTAADRPHPGVDKTVKRNRFLIASLAVMLVWLIATLAYIVPSSIGGGGRGVWLVFIYAVPVSSTVALIFNSVWGNRRVNFLIVSILMWSVFASVYLSLLVFGHTSVWLIFTLGAPGEIIILLWSGINFGKKQNHDSTAAVKPKADRQAVEEKE